MHTYDAVFITTSNCQGARHNELKRMLDSVAETVDQYGVTIVHYVLLQNYTSEYELVEFPDFVRILKVDHLLSLSKARNILLKKALQDGTLDSSSILAFPDDDAWYIPEALNAILEQFKIDQLLDIFFCKYGSKPFEINPKELHLKLVKPSTKEFVQNLSSSTLFSRTKLIKYAGLFDEELGLGAPINGGEDLDYGLRLYTQPKVKVRYLHAALIGHRDRVDDTKIRYFEGSLCALARLSLSHLGIFVQFIRKLLVGFYFLITRKIVLRKYCSAIVLAGHRISKDAPNL